MYVDIESAKKENWVVLEEFPLYAVSDQGFVTNLQRGIDLTPTPNVTGHLRVGLMDPKDRRQKTRSVAVLVATCFLPKPAEHWDTPIHKDGDKSNCAVDNLMWRPRWYAIMYHKQFGTDALTTEPQQFVETMSGKVYPNLYEAVIDNGIFAFDIIKSAVEHTRTPLTNQEFRFVT